MRLIRIVVAMTLLISLIPGAGPGVVGADSNTASVEEGAVEEILSPVWNISIRRWSVLIKTTSEMYGIDPDFIAAVMNAESNGRDYVVSRAGAVGLMGVMPSSPGLEWRPQPEELMDPAVNMRWGGAILSDIIQQSGGDIYAALAAYSGGWDQANRRVPQEYAARVLNEYGRAVAARNGVSPAIASHWTVAVEIRQGHIPVESLLFGQRPLSGLQFYGEHIVYKATDKKGRTFFVKGYAMPLALLVPFEAEQTHFGSSDLVEADLMVRLNLMEIKAGNSNPRVLLACLPSLSRLRGRVSTRWYAPSHCPSWHRRGAATG
jgi:hypothetical protein